MQSVHTKKVLFRVKYNSNGNLFKVTNIHSVSQKQITLEKREEPKTTISLKDTVLNY
jgi:hypothetical protein